MKALLPWVLCCVVTAAQADLTAKPVAPIKATINPKLVAVAPPHALGPDLAIESASQTSPNFWIVRVKNIGGGKSPATTVKVTLTVYPKNGGLGNLVGFGTAPMDALEPGKLTDVNVTTNVNSNSTMIAEAIVNPDKKFLETNYGNNYSTKPAGY